MRILIINAGSSSLKYQLMDADTGAIEANGIAERIGINGSIIKYERPDKETEKRVIELPNHTVAMENVLELLTSEEFGVLDSMDEIDAVGHRVLQGGEAFAGSYVIDDEVIEAIKLNIPLGPLHNPANLAGIMACRKAMPDKPQVAVFDTAFHASMPEHAFMYALPYHFYTDYRVRRYGFHGTSHQYVSEEAAKILDRDPKELKIVTCHLGNGSSITAVDGGKSVDTSMGMTPLAGVPMGTRTGDLDPAILKYLMELDLDEEDAFSIQDLDTIMNKQSGVLGISGVSSDFRDLAAAANEGNKRARLALKMFTYNVRKYIGAYAAAMGGLDCIVFTAGIGENTSDVRAECVEGLEFLGAELDPARNEEFNHIGGEISKEGSRVKILIIPTNEELAIARETARLVEGA